MDHKRLSKTVAHALRHEPRSYGLNLDPDGFTAVDLLLRGLRLRNPEFGTLDETDVLEMIATSRKDRFEYKEGKVRALYGHSAGNAVSIAPNEPPELLFHGTGLDAARLILDGGLRPMKRQFVHLTSSQEYAMEAGSRERGTPLILVALAGQASRRGVRFYRANEVVWLSGFLPPRFILPLNH